MAKFRPRAVTVDAVLYDGELVGEGVQIGQDAAWKVQPRTCPEWFPAITKVVDDHPLQLIPGGAVVQIDNDLHIGTRDGVLVARPGDWLVLSGDLLTVVSGSIFSDLYERA